MRALVLLVALVAACRGGAPVGSVSVVDFIREFDRADSRPVSSFAVSNFSADGVTRPAIVGPAPSRLTWTLPLPHGGRLRMHVAAATAAVRVRVGVSDTRVYERLAETLIQPGAWTPLDVDLSRYAGWKPSLFYRPDRVQWHVVLSADAVTGPATVAWGTPEVAAPQDAVQEYLRRVNSATPQLHTATTPK